MPTLILAQPEEEELNQSPRFHDLQPPPGLCVPALNDPDPYEFQIVSNSIRSIHEKGYEQGYVMKNDPFKKEMLLSSKEVLIEKGKLLDEQIKCRDCGKIIQSSGNTKTIDICKRRILPGTSSIKDIFQIRKILLANPLNAIEN